MAIRSATPEDRLEWSAMRTALWPDTPDGHLAEIDEFYAGKSVDIVELFIAEADGKVAGFLELNLRNFAEGSRETRVPYVEGWYVKPEFQGRGLGRQLMSHAEQWSIKNGYAELASDAEIENEKSIAMHKSLGFKEIDRVVCLLKKLEKN